MIAFRQAALGLALVIVASVNVRGATESVVPEEMTWEPETVTNDVPDAPPAWFPVGERLTYTVHWGLFHVATTVVGTDWVKWPDDRFLLRIQYRTRSNRVIAKLFPVDDVLASYIDPATFLPVRFYKNMNEGNRHEVAVTDFDHRAGTVRWRKRVRNMKDLTLPIPPETRDIPTLLFWLRKDGFEAGSTNLYKVIVDDKVIDLALAPTDQKETITVPGMGAIPIFRIEPEASFEGLFLHKGKITVWISQGAPCLITRMEATLPFASVRIQLAKIEGPNSGAWTNLWQSIPGR